MLTHCITEPSGAPKGQSGMPKREMFSPIGLNTVRLLVLPRVVAP